MTKLTKALRDSIVKGKDTKTTKGLADEFGVSQSTIRRVLREATAEANMKSPNEEVAMEAPVAQNRIVQPSRPTITLGHFKLGDGADPETERQTWEMLMAEDENENQNFANEWEEETEQSMSVEEAEEEEKPPTKADEKKLREIEQAEQVFLQQALNPNPVELAETAKVIEDESAIRSKYLSRIYLNVINFSELLPFIGNKDKFLASLHKKTTKELISLSGLIETQRSLGNVANQMKHAFIIFTRGTEFVSTKFMGLKTEGFADELLKREREIEMLFQEIAVEQADTLKSYTSPQMRLALIFTSTLMITDSRNRVVSRTKIQGERVSPDLEQRFADI